MTYTKEQLEESMWKFYHKHGKAPAFKELTGDEYICGSVYTKRYGTFKAAVEQILQMNSRGRKYNDNKLVDYIHDQHIYRTHSAYTDEELSTYIRIYVDKHHKIPNPSQISSDPTYPQRDVFINRFGSWNNALIAAGFNPRNTNTFHTICESCGNQTAKAVYSNQQSQWMCRECAANSIGKSPNSRYGRTTKTMTLAYKRERCAAILHSAFQMRKFETRFDSIWNHNVSPCAFEEMI